MIAATLKHACSPRFLLGTDLKSELQTGFCESAVLPHCCCIFYFIVFIFKSVFCNLPWFMKSDAGQNIDSSYK